MEKNLLSRIERLEDHMQIQSLASRYCWIVDAGLDAKDESYIDMLLELFSEEPQVDYGPFGKYAGREEIRAFFRDSVYGNFESFRHYVQNFVIDIDGPNADARYYLNFYAIKDGRPLMASGKYQGDCVKKGGAWKFRRLTAEFYIFNHLEAAWGERKIFFG